MTGILKEIDPTTHTFVVQRSECCNQVKLTWNERTRFVADRRFTSFALLKTGNTVVVTYRSPFFGESFAKKVVIGSSDAHRLAKCPPCK